MESQHKKKLLICYLERRENIYICIYILRYGPYNGSCLQNNIINFLSNVLCVLMLWSWTNIESLLEGNFDEWFQLNCVCVCVCVGLCVHTYISSVKSFNHVIVLCDYT